MDTLNAAGSGISFPLSKVGKYLENGNKESLRFFAEFLLKGAPLVPPTNVHNVSVVDIWHSVSRFNDWCQKNSQEDVKCQQLTRLLNVNNWHVYYALRRFSRLTQGKIGERFGISHSAISHAVKRFEARLLKDKHLREAFTSLEQTIQNSKTDT